jgi:short-subunit dehydrogenase
MINQERIAVVTGSSTGIGLETSLHLARNGFYTYATMRDSNKKDLIEKISNKEKLPLKILPMDVNDGPSVSNAINKIFDEKKKIDVLINNAGYGLFGALEDMSMEEIKKQFDTNLFGAIRTIKEILPIMREQNHGIIINITSLAGVVGIPAESVYVSTKFALEGLSESISYELQQYGIKVILVEPGVINTNFVPNIKFPNKNYNRFQNILTKENEVESTTYNNTNTYIKEKNLSYYSNTVDAFLSHYYPAMKSGLHPKEVAIVILDAINHASISSDYLFRYTIGEIAQNFVQAKKNLSDSELYKFISEKTLS